MHIYKGKIKEGIVPIVMKGRQPFENANDLL